MSARRGPLTTIGQEAWLWRDVFLHAATQTLVAGTEQTLGQALANDLLPLWRRVHAAVCAATERNPELLAHHPDGSRSGGSYPHSCGEDDDEEAERTWIHDFPMAWYSSILDGSHAAGEWRQLLDHLARLNLYGYRVKGNKVAQPEWLWRSVLVTLSRALVPCGCLPPSLEMISPFPDADEFSGREGSMGMPRITSVLVEAGLMRAPKWVGGERPFRWATTHNDLVLPGWDVLAETWQEWRNRCQKVLEEYTEVVWERAATVSGLKLVSEKPSGKDHAQWTAMFQIGGRGYQQIAAALDHKRANEPDGSVRSKVLQGVRAMAELIELPLRSV